MKSSDLGSGYKSVERVSRMETTERERERVKDTSGSLLCPVHASPYTIFYLRGCVGWRRVSK